MLVQGSLFDAAEPVAAPVCGDLAAVRREQLSRGAWVDLLPGWVTGSDALFAALRDEVPWHAERREMFDRVVAVPRLTKFYEEHEPLPHPALALMRDRLSSHYAAELGEPFVTAGLCLYRDGSDSVAWHGDRIGRSRTTDTMVAIVSVGSARELALRPVGGGPSRRYALGHGDLVVMGGSCQRTWEHAVLKSARAAGARISIQLRVRGVR